MCWWKMSRMHLRTRCCGPWIRSPPPALLFSAAAMSNSITTGPRALRSSIACWTAARLRLWPCLRRLPVSDCGRSPVSSSAVAQPAYGTTRWPLHLGLLAAAALLWAFAYQGDIARAVQIWWISPTYSHCFLVIPISAWLIWRRRFYLAKAHPQFYAPAMWMMIPAALLWLVGKAAAINEAQQLAVMLQF